MLYNKNWDAKTVTSDPFTLESLIGWLETKDPNEHYAWHCQGECMLGQWLKSIDPASAEDPDGDSMAYIVHGNAVDLNAFSDIALLGDAYFGAALDRAREALAK